MAELFHKFASLFDGHTKSGAMLIWLLRLAFGAISIGVAFVAFHPMIQFIALEGFFAQVTGAGLALLIFWTNTKLFDRNSARFDKLRLWILLTLSTCGLLLSQTSDSTQSRLGASTSRS